jgi:arginine deiminase
LDRRKVLLGAGALALAISLPRTSSASMRAFAISETGALQRVLVHSPAAMNPADCGLHCTDPFWHEAVDAAVAQHIDLVAQLESAGAEVLQFDDLLSSVDDAAKRRGVRIHVERRYTAGLSYMRDFAVMLPRGLLLCNVSDPARAHEQALFRSVTAFAPAFQAYPVLFDAAGAGLPAEGGDFQVLDARTLLVGVGNHTDARIAPLLARKIGMDVIAVNIRNADQRKWRLDHDPLRDFFLHLDTSVAQVAEGHALTLPWLFEAKRTGRAALKRSNDLIADFGTVTRYEAESGAHDASIAEIKLVDYLRGRGIEVSAIESAFDDDFDRWLADTHRSGAIVPRRHRQAANVLATSRGVLLALKGAERTHASLSRARVRVCTLSGCEMWRGYGGPHCLTLPLERAG